MLLVFSAKFLPSHISAAFVIVSAPAGASNSLHYFCRGPGDSFTVFIVLMDTIILGCKLLVLKDPGHVTHPDLILDKN